jgi:hypothetical protein
MSESNGTKILICTCVSAYQDEKYGKGKRVHNYAPKAHGKNPGWRCTVCCLVRGVTP